MDSPIILTKENPGEMIHFHLDNTTRPAYEGIHSTTITINPFDPFHVSLINAINSFDSSDNNIVNSSVKFISLIFVKQSTLAPGTVPPYSIRGLKYLEDTPTGTPPTDLAVVATIADGSILQLLHKPKRTKGKVSNTLG